jgi:hypothetical protein
MFNIPKLVYHRQWLDSNLGLGGGTYYTPASSLLLPALAASKSAAKNAGTEPLETERRLPTFISTMSSSATATGSYRPAEDLERPRERGRSPLNRWISSPTIEKGAHVMSAQALS